MAIKKPIPISFNLDGQYSVQSVCAVIHIDDKNTETLDLSLMQGGEHIAVSHNSTVTARFVRVKDKILISDNVACTVQENGNIHIPIDNAAAHMLVGEIKIEVNIVDENDILTMQFPLIIRVNNTILADAEISPESEGTIPELLEEAREAAEDAAQAAEAATEAISTKQDKLTAGQNITITEENVISASSGSNDYTDLTNKPSINNVTLSGNKTSDDLNLQDKLTAGNNITIENNVISSEGGIDDYNDLSNKPSINGIELLGNKTDSDLGIQKALTAGENVNISQQGEISVDLSRKVDKTQTIVGCSLSGDISRSSFLAGLFSRQVIVESTNYPPSGAYEGLYIYPCIWISSDQKTVWLMTDIQSIGSGYQTFSWQRLNTKTYVSTEPAPNSTGSNVQPLYDIGDMWVQKTNNDTLKNIYICIAKQYVNISSRTWKYTYTWVDISQAFSSVVSAVVNANGTITFTDSEGNSFTTSGSKLVTSGNEQISMGYDEGGFYFLFDDGQEEVNNGTD